MCLYACVRGGHLPRLISPDAEFNMPTQTDTGSAPGPAALMKQPVSSSFHYIQTSGQRQQLHYSFPQSSHRQPVGHLSFIRYTSNRT